MTTVRGYDGKMLTPPASPLFDPTKEKVCTRCNKVFSLYSERCPHCGKDSKVGTQGAGLLFTLGLLMLAPIAMLLLIWIFW